MKISVKRVYETPAKSDGARVLVDRLWPRGVSKKKAAIDIWAKDLTPSTSLRDWFHKDPERHYKEFSTRYRKELSQLKPQAKDLKKGQARLTLVSAVRDIKRSHVPILVSFLERQ